MRAPLAALAVVSLVACPKPTDSTPLIPIQPNLKGRIELLDRFHGKHDPHAPPAPARVHVMKEGEELRGPNAVGRPGDLLLENGEVAFVIDQLGAGMGFAESGGNLVDAADARARID